MRWFLGSACAAALSLCSVSPVFAQPYGFEGTWGLVGTQCATRGDTVPTEVTATEIRFYESRCAIAEVTPVGEAGATWQITAECRGEGEQWSVPFLFAILETDGHQSMAIINMDYGTARLTERCS